VWGLDGAGQIWHFNSQAQNWDQITVLPLNTVAVAVGADQAVWAVGGIDSAQQIYRFR
jgi:hypothetical protein